MRSLLQEERLATGRVRPLRTIKQPFNVNNVLKNGNLYHSPHLSLKVLSVQNPTLNTTYKSSFYFIVSGKIIKKALKRNLFKRRGRSIVRSFDVKDGFEGVFFAKKGAGELKFEDIKGEVLDLIKKAGILNL